MAYLSLHDVSVEFLLNMGGSLKTQMLQAATRFVKNNHSGRVQSFRALDSINLHFADGDRIGIIGENGAGKTTLLKVLSGIYEPTSGVIQSAGQVSSLLSLTGGSHPELTGYENIKAQLLIRGVKKKDLDHYVEDIAHFSELGDFLNIPLKCYSSGMAMRLCFAVATKISPDILVMDEWISAGDQHFIEKAKARIQDMVQRSKIVIFGSHDLSLVQKAANKTIWMHQGRVKMFGKTSDVVDAYQGNGKRAESGAR